MTGSTIPRTREATASPAKAKSARLDEDLERERLEPGLNTAGKGDVGTDPAQSKSRGNSNT
jgi:hypothetical protein